MEQAHIIQLHGPTQAEHVCFINSMSVINTQHYSSTHCVLQQHHTVINSNKNPHFGTIHREKLHHNQTHTTTVMALRWPTKSFFVCQPFWLPRSIICAVGPELFIACAETTYWPSGDQSRRKTCVVPPHCTAHQQIWHCTVTSHQQISHWRNTNHHS